MSPPGPKSKVSAPCEEVDTKVLADEATGSVAVTTNIAQVAPVYEAVLDVVAPPVAAMAGELPPAGVGVFVGARSSNGAIDRYQWYAYEDRAGALECMRRLTEGGHDFYLCAALHHRADTPSDDTAAVIATVWADADVEHVAADGKTRHKGGSKNRDGAKAAVAKLATSLLPAASLIVGTSESGGVQAWYRLDQWVDVDVALDILDELRDAARQTGGAIDASVYTPGQRMRAGGQSTTIEHVSTLATPIDVDNLLQVVAQRHRSVVRHATTMSRGTEWIDSHPEVFEELLERAGWTRVRRPRPYGEGTMQLWRHPDASHTQSGSLLRFGRSWCWTAFSDSTAFAANRPYTPIAAVATILGHGEGV